MIPISNKANIAANCEFKILPGGFNDYMHSFYIMPSKYNLKANDCAKISMTMKYNPNSGDEELLYKNKEIRKILNVNLKNTDINIAFPLRIMILDNGKKRTTSDEIRKMF